MMKRLLASTMAVLLALTAPLLFSTFVGKTHLAYAAINAQINYQAKLTDANRLAVANGNYNLEFKLYTTPSGGSPIWTETWCKSADSGITCDGTGVDNRVAVANGLFNVMLGSTTALSTVNFDQTLYLSVNVGGTTSVPVWDGEMSPRKIIGASAAAIEARRLGGLNSSQFLRADITNSTSTATTFVTINQTGAGNALDIKNGSTQIFSALSSGNIGIGTTSPYAKLSIVGTVVAASFNATSTSATSSFLGTFSIGSTTPGSSSLFSVGTSSALFYVDKQSGNVGIGTTTPSSILDIGVAGEELFRVDNTENGRMVLDATGPHQQKIEFIPRNGSYNDRSTIFANNTLDINGTSGEVLLGNRNNAYVRVADYANEILFGQSNTEFMRITGSGLLGIGTTTPYAKLSVTGSSASSNSIFAVASSTEATLFTVMPNGNIGIGTTSPYARLSVAGSVVAANFNATSTASSTFAGPVVVSSTATSTFANGINLTAGCVSINGVCISGGGGSGTVGSGTAGQIPFYNTASTILTATSSLFIAQSGNIGIGTTTPTSALSISGRSSSGSVPLLTVTAEPTAGATTTAFTVFKSGRAAFGTSTEDNNHIVTISGTTTGASVLGLQNNNSNGYTALDFINSSGVQRGYLTWVNAGVSSAANTFALGTIGGFPINLTASGVNDLTVASTGNIGIGTTSPYSKLSVAGSVVAANFNATSTTATSSLLGALSLGSTTPSATSLFSVGTSTPHFLIDRLSGRIAVGATTTTETFNVEGTIKYSNALKFTLTAGASSVAVTFPKPFSAIPAVVCTPRYQTSFWISAVSITGFTFNVGTTDSYDQAINCIAIATSL